MKRLQDEISIKKEAIRSEIENQGWIKKFDGDVYLTARSDVRGKAAIEDLEKEGLTVYFHQLDITHKKSIGTLRDFIKNISESFQN